MALSIITIFFNSKWSTIPTPASIAIVIGTLIILASAIYRAALPKPIPDIPYNKISANRLLGDVPDMNTNASSGLRYWMRDQFAIHNSPIVQIFVAPFKKPWVLVADFREAQDVVMRRGREFDKSSLTNESFSGVVAASHICMKSSDSRFKSNRELIKDLMSSQFLNEVIPFTMSIQVKRNLSHKGICS